MGKQNKGKHSHQSKKGNYIQGRSYSSQKSNQSNHKNAMGKSQSKNKYSQRNDKNKLNKKHETSRNVQSTRN